MDTERFIRFKAKLHRSASFQQMDMANDELDLAETQILDDGQKLIFSYLASMMLAEDRAQHFEVELQQILNEVRSDLLKANLKMLELRFALKRRQQNAAIVAMEVQYFFELADCQ